jgi:ABC-type antimicrobial peptide transport system permease subunit
MVLGDVGKLMLVGIAMGSILAIAAGRTIQAMLFGLEPGDLLTLALAAGVMILAGFLSAAWPARRAAGIDPVKALRES